MKNDASPAVPAILRQACWIWPDSLSWDLHNGYALFRKKLDLAKAPRRAPLFITADQSYHLYINGRFVCRGPARGFQAHWPYDEVEVTGFLRKGTNLVAIRAHNPGFSNFQYISQSIAGLLVAGQFGRVRLLSDATWKCCRQQAVLRGSVPNSRQLFCQEHFDARLDDPRWVNFRFDDRKWLFADQCPWNIMPWAALEARGIPMLGESKRWPKRFLGECAGRCASDYRTTSDVVRTRYAEPLAHEPAPGSARRIAAPVTGKDRFWSCLLDFGQTVVGNLTLEVNGAKGGELVDMLHVETIDQARLRPHLVNPAVSKIALGNRLICRRGNTVHDFYHLFGFRYLVLTVRDSAVPMRIRVSLNAVGYPFEQKGRFASSNRTLEHIWNTCVWTQRCCSLDAYVDTPWREQAQWWGDARVQAWNTFHFSGDARIFRRGIHCIASQTTPNGLTYSHAPTGVHSILPDFSLIWVITLWDYYWQTGSLEAFQTHEAVLEGVLEYFRNQTDAATGLVSYDKRYWLFLDWTDLFKDGFSSVYNLWLLLALDRSVEMYRLTGETQKAKTMDRWARPLRSALRKLLTKDGLLCDGLTFDGKLVVSTSIHAQTLAILANLNPSSVRVMLDRILLPYIRGQSNPPVQPSAYWVTYLFDVLARHGYGHEVVAFIEKRWRPMVAHGTTWEVFDPAPGAYSHSHAWSAHPIFHLMRVIGGIEQIAPCWQRIRFRPHFIGEHGGATIPAPPGEIISHWERRGSRIEVRLSLPKGVAAEVLLPGRQADVVTGWRSWSIPAI